MLERGSGLSERLCSFFELANTIPELERRLFIVLQLLGIAILLASTLLIPLRDFDYFRLVSNLVMLVFLASMSLLLWQSRKRQELLLFIMFIGAAAWVLVVMLCSLLLASPQIVAKNLISIAAPWMIWLIGIYLGCFLTFRPRTALRMSLMLTIICMSFLLYGIIHARAFDPMVFFDFALLFFANVLVIGMAFPLAQSQARSAQTDFLTATANRSHGYARLVAEIGRAERYQESFSIILFDIDHFKRINDECGHPCGDTVLQQVAGFTNAHIRRSDLLARWGGEEFLLLMTRSDLASARLKADHLRQQLKNRAFHTDIRLTASFGVTTYYPYDSANSMLERADAALYRAKRNGRNCVEVE